MVKVTLDILGEKIEGDIFKIETVLTGESTIDIIFPTSRGSAICDNVVIRNETMLKIVAQLKKEAEANEVKVTEE